MKKNTQHCSHTHAISKCLFKGKLLEIYEVID